MLTMITLLELITKYIVHVCMQGLLFPGSFNFVLRYEILISIVQYIVHARLNYTDRLSVTFVLHSDPFQCFFLCQGQVCKSRPILIYA